MPKARNFPATMQPTDAGFTLVFNDALAAYPVTVDPLILNEEAKLFLGDASFDRFGASVAISDNYIVIGASGDDDTGSDSGSAYVFEKRNGSS